MYIGMSGEVYFQKNNLQKEIQAGNTLHGLSRLVSRASYHIFRNCHFFLGKVIFAQVTVDCLKKH